MPKMQKAVQEPASSLFIVETRVDCVVHTATKYQRLILPHTNEQTTSRRPEKIKAEAEREHKTDSFREYLILLLANQLKSSSC
jgi:hypothetical protein